MPDITTFDLEAAIHRVREGPGFVVQGRVTQIVGTVIEAAGLDLAVGERCEIESNSGRLLSEVVGFHERGLMLMPFGDVSGVRPGALVRSVGTKTAVSMSPALVGRVLNGLGVPIDGRGSIDPVAHYPLDRAAPNPLERSRITTQLHTGVRAIDGLLSLGRGQRMGIFAGSGVGKSVLLGMMARHTAADVNVIALLGERGREVREFIERDLGPDGLQRSVIVVATSDQPALERAQGALTATAIAEWFRDQGRDVLLMMDSVTRVGMAGREIALAVGEPAVTKGYPPSVFASLARLMERAGNAATGSITGLYTVLVEADDLNDPIADHARSVLDGHVVLSRELASAGHYPAIDVLESVSRVRDAVIDDEHREAAVTLLRLEATYRQAEDLIAVGAYKPGSDPEVDRAIRLRDATLAYLRQHPNDYASPEQILKQLHDYHHAVQQLEQNPS